MPSKKEERKEDLNPRSDDVDEKIRQLLDPTIPDNKEAKEDKPQAKKKSSIEIKDVSGKKPIGASQDSESDETAPELPSKKTSKKTIVPISHDDEEPASEPEVEEDEPKPIVKIEIDHADESKEEVAEKLDEAIAELGNEKSKDDEDKAETKADEEEGSPDKTAEVDKTESDADEEEPADEEGDKEEPASEDKPPTKVKVTAGKKEETKPDTSEPEELEESDLIKDDETEEAVKEIVSKEGDELLKKEDAVLESKKAKTENKKPKKSFKQIFFGKTARRVFGVVLLLALIGAAVYPSSRYFMLNSAGVRSSSSLTVIDTSSQQPLKNVLVNIGGNEAKTDSDGVVEFTGLKLGPTTLTIERTAFATVEQELIVGWGSNPLGNFLLDPTGAQYKFELTDFLSGEAVSSAELDSEYASARADENGLVILTLPPLEQQKIEVSIIGDGYRSELVELDLNSTQISTIEMTASKKHVFVSKRSGKYDIYSIYADGQEEKLLLEATGTEREDIALLPSQETSKAAYASTRSGKQNSDGYLLTDLVLLDVETGETDLVATSEKIQLVGWWSNSLVYVTTGSGESAAKPDRSKLISYDISNGKEVVIAQANYFNDLSLIKDTIYYAPSGVYSQENGRFYSSNLANPGVSKTLFDGEVWSIIRTSFSDLALSSGQDWYGYSVGDETAAELPNNPVDTTDRFYLANHSSDNAAWVDQRDGKGVLLNYNLGDQSDNEIATDSGIKRPLAWLNKNSVVYRVETRDETADYVVSLEGGKPKKITDVTSTSNQNSWYFY